MLSHLPANIKILDIGCGSGMQTIHLAGICDNCHITAVDVYQPYLDSLMEKAAYEGVADRISTVCVSMDYLPFRDNEFDIIWSEGAIFVMGFEKGLSYWKQFLKKGGFMVLTETSWFTDCPSEEVFQFWNKCYPDIAVIAQNEKRIESAGYTIIDRFKIPASAWWDDYYNPLGKRLDQIEDKFKGNSEAESIIEFVKKEMDIFSQYSDEYGYVFFVLQKQ
jgi:ubiquinone/menaquinone biosynthesis C-methylase UbiE